MLDIAFFFFLELQQIESCLTRVEQSPPESMLNALSPSLKALSADKLMKHSDSDVKVALASCFSEITRITAPDAPYDDAQMKVRIMILCCKLIEFYYHVLNILHLMSFMLSFSFRRSLG